MVERQPGEGEGARMSGGPYNYSYIFKYIIIGASRGWGGEGGRGLGRRERRGCVGGWVGPNLCQMKGLCNSSQGEGR